MGLELGSFQMCLLFFLKSFYLFIFGGFLSPQPGNQTMPPAVKAQNRNPWTAGKSPDVLRLEVFHGVWWIRGSRDVF